MSTPTTTSSTISLDGLPWAYVERGSGPLLMFFHGRLLGKHQWDDVIDALCERYRCVAFDWVGHGESGYSSAGWSMSDLAAAVPRLMDALGEAAAALIGLSQGGAISMRVAVETPERVRALVTMSAGGDSPSQEALDAQARLGLVLRDGGEDERRAAVTAFQPRFHAPGWIEAHPAEAERERQLILGHDRRAMPFVTSPLPDIEPIDLQARFGEIRCPTLVVWGSHDVRAHWGPTMAEQIPDARLTTITDAGHDVVGDAPEQTTTAVVEFLDSVYRSPAADGTERLDAQDEFPAGKTHLDAPPARRHHEGEESS